MLKQPQDTEQGIKDKQLKIETDNYYYFLSIRYIWKHSKKCKELYDIGIIITILIFRCLTYSFCLWQCSTSPVYLRKLFPKEAMRNDARKINASKRPHSNPTRKVFNSIVYDLWYLWTRVICLFVFFLTLSGAVICPLINFCECLKIFQVTQQLLELSHNNFNNFNYRIAKQISGG